MFIEAGIIFVVTLLISYALKKGLDLIYVAKKIPVKLVKFFESTHLPLQILIWGIGAITIFHTFDLSFIALFTDENLKIARKVLFVGVVGWLCFRSKSFLEQYLFEKLATKDNEHDRFLFTAVSRTLTIAMIVLVGLIFLDIIGLPLNALLTFGGVGGIALGWAAKDVFANFFGGMMIFMNRHFSVGDWIKSPNKNFEGVVEQIGWYMTQIRTFERRPTFIPNSIITEAIIENPGRMYNRRIKATIGVRYEDADRLESIVEAIRTMLKEHQEVDERQLLLVHFIGFGAHSLDIEIYCFTKATKAATFRDVQESILLKIRDIIAEQGAQIAFPTQTVILEKSPIG